ncbi:MAG: potassium/proton antiporter [Clostridia bacterium]|nr:potassium/proton antiporter [Clostridia bacterium]
METWLLIISVILIICILMERLCVKLGVPALILFLGLGQLAGAIGVMPADMQGLETAENLCTIGLMIIMFYGGYGTGWQRSKSTAVKAGLLSTAGVVLTALLTAAFCCLCLKTTFAQGLLCGSVIASTDAASVFSILRSRRLNLKYGTAPLLELESGSNDPAASIMTLLSLALLQHSMGTGDVVLMVTKQIVFGLLVGFGLGYGVVYVLRRARVRDDAALMLVILSVGMLSYALAAVLGGNGYLAVYLTGIVLGNSKLPGKRQLVHFFDGITGFMQVMVFFVLGLNCRPELLLTAAPRALAIAAFLTFVARPAVVFGLLKPFRAKNNQILMVSFCGLRGASAIVFAVMAVLALHTELAFSLFYMTFFIVLFSILLQGSLIPFAAKKLHMIDPHDNVMKTFSDYEEHSTVQFMHLDVSERHPWANMTIAEARPAEVLGGGRIVLILRGEEQLHPRGDTRILPGDTLVVSGGSITDKDWGLLNEQHIDESHPWCGRQLCEITLRNDQTVVMIMRGDQSLIAHGGTVIQSGDIVILNERN